MTLREVSNVIQALENLIIQCGVIEELNNVKVWAEEMKQDLTVLMRSIIHMNTDDIN